MLTTADPSAPPTPTKRNLCILMEEDTDGDCIALTSRDSLGALSRMVDAGSRGLPSDSFRALRRLSASSLVPRRGFTASSRRMSSMIQPRQSAAIVSLLGGEPLTPMVRALFSSSPSSGPSSRPSSRPSWLLFSLVPLFSRQCTPFHHAATRGSPQIELVLDFADSVSVSSLTLAAEGLRSALYTSAERCLEKRTASVPSTITFALNPIVRMSASLTPQLQFDPELIAAQMTDVDFRIFKRLGI